jgi:amidohydrolase
MKEMTQVIARHRAEMDRIGRAIHDNPEIRFEEKFAAETLTGWLGEHGFSVQRGVGGLETAFVARHEGGGGDGPTVAILMEYDALPGLGHGCGHSLIAAGGALAAIAAAEVFPDHPGTLLAIGTPGEEGGGGKILMLEAGVFDGVDAAMMFHPGDRGIIARHALAVDHLGFRFTGRAAHAAKNPEAGRSALAAAQLFLTAVDVMRQFVPSSARMHGIVTNGGAAPNVVPALAEVSMYIRDLTEERVADLVVRVTDAAHGAALATGCRAEIYTTSPAYGERSNNMTLAERFAEPLAADSGIVLEPPSASNPAGSTDVGNLSRALPIIHPYLQIAERGTPSHSVEMREAAGRPEARERAALMAAALAKTALDALTDPEFFAAVRAEFEGALEGART